MCTCNVHIHVVMLYITAVYKYMYMWHILVLVLLMCTVPVPVLLIHVRNTGTYTPCIHVPEYECTSMYMCTCTHTFTRYTSRLTLNWIFLEFRLFGSIPLTTTLLRRSYNYIVYITKQNIFFATTVCYTR